MRLKGLSTTAFFTAFNRLQRAGETAPGQRRWTAHGLSWTRGRHSYYGPDYSMTIEVVRVSTAGAKGWTLMMVREGWWAEDKEDPVKSQQWAHLVKGDRGKVLADIARLVEDLDASTS